MGTKLNEAIKRAEDAEKALNGLVADLLEREDIEFRADQQRIVDQIKNGTIPVRALRDRITSTWVKSGADEWGSVRITINAVDPISRALLDALA